MTLYGPGIAFGAPSSGSVVLTRSALALPRPGPWAALPRPGPCAALPRSGPWANETHAVRTNAVVSADFMRRSLADGNTTGSRQPIVIARGKGGWLGGRDLNSKERVLNS